MNTLTFPLSAIPDLPRDKASGQDPYASEAQTNALLRFGAQYRLQRIQAADMITTDEAAALSGTTRVTMNAWIKSGRCIGVSHLRRGYKLPRWQFDRWLAIAGFPGKPAPGTGRSVTPHRVGARHTRPTRDRSGDGRGALTASFHEIQRPASTHP
jgi:excisionase family DNA binding protein